MHRSFSTESARQKFGWGDSKQRLKELIQVPGVVIEDSGEVTAQRNPRRLVRVRMPEGRTAGAILQEEDLAGVWTPDGGQLDWCRPMPRSE